MYPSDPAKAGELAISAIELVLTGEMSSDDLMIDIALQALSIQRDRDEDNYNKKEQMAKIKKIEDMKLDKIAELYSQKISQKRIGEMLDISQQTVSYRINIIKEKYPELLPNDNKQITKDTKSTNEILVKNSDIYQNTKVTKNTKIGTIGTSSEISSLVQTEEFGKKEEVVVEEKP
jgi:predicted transcriptional regulator